MGSRAPARGLRLFQSQHSREQRRWLLFLSRAGQPNAFGLSGRFSPNALVPGLSPQPGSRFAATRSSFQHGLEGSVESGGNRQTLGGGVSDSERWAAPELLDMSSLADGMSDQDIDDPMHQHDTNEHDSHDGEQPEDLTVRERPLDLAAVRARLQSKSGPQYWRTIEELAGDPHFEALL